MSRPQRCTEVRNVWHRILRFHFRNSHVGVIRLGIVSCFYQSNKNGVMGSRWSPERMCAVDFSIATSMTQCLTPLGIARPSLGSTDAGSVYWPQFLPSRLPQCETASAQNPLHDEMVNLPPLSATCENMLSFWGAGRAHHLDTVSMQPQFFCCVFVVSSFPERLIPKACSAGHGTVCFLILLMDCDLCPWL